MAKLFWVCLCVCVLWMPHQVYALKVTKVAEWKVKGSHEGARWSADGKRILYSHRSGKTRALSLFFLKTKASKQIAKGTLVFYPSFGPVGTVFAGPPKQPNWKGVLFASKKPKGKKAPKKPTPVTSGIVMWGYGKKSILFPGWKPQYSAIARKLLFEFKGIMYLWDPMKSRRKGLMILGRGVAPVWSGDGRAIAFQKTPFLIKKGVPSGGGVVIVDMLFRAARVAKVGGQITWAGDTQSLAYVSVVKKPPFVNGTTGVYWKPLKGKKKPILLAMQAHQPHMPPTNIFSSDWVAYTDHVGVWVMNIQKKQKTLVAKGASHPRLSSDGLLLVKQRDTYVVYKPHILR